MSDHVWLTRGRSALAAEAIGVVAGQVQALKALLPGDNYQELRSQILAAAGVLHDVAEQVESGYPASDTGPCRRNVGENTRRGLRRMAGNRGWSVR